MADVFTRDKRSEVMSSIRGRGNRSTEWRLRARLVSAGIAGWRLHSRDVVGTPDFTFPDGHLAVFVDGCFWHGCRCKTIPESNHEFWMEKIQRNKRRDREVNSSLKKSGWTVLRFWEHQIKKEPGKCIETVRRALRQ
ncbi:MAG: very short patch repair endonuclease [Thermodesulfovibrionales bacterium]